MFDEKGFSLSINMLVIIIIAVVVLFSILAIYMGTVPGSSGQMECESKIRDTCMEYTRCGCCEDGTSTKCTDYNCNPSQPDECEENIEWSEVCCN